MVISESMTKQFFPSSDPLGHYLVIDWDGPPRFGIVGIVDEVLSDLNLPVEPTRYFLQNSGRFGYGSLVVRSHRDVAARALSDVRTQRKNAIGIRAAPGAQRSHMMNIMFLDGLRPTASGLLLGFIIGGVCAELIRSLLLGVQPLGNRFCGGRRSPALHQRGLSLSHLACGHVAPVTVLKYE
jgi:hypothetical protein